MAKFAKIIKENNEIFLIIAPGYESSIKSFTLTNGDKYDI